MDKLNLGTAIQDVLTRGLDAAAAYYTNRLTVNDPAGRVTGPDGRVTTIGQPIGGGTLGAVVSSVPTWAWIAGIVVLGGVIALRR